MILLHSYQLTLLLLCFTDCGVANKPPARGKQLHLLSSSSGVHQGHQHPAALSTNQHPAWPPHLQGQTGPLCHAQGECHYFDAHVTYLSLDVVFRLGSLN